MTESVCVSPQIHQPKRDLPGSSLDLSFQETHCRCDIPKLWTSARHLATSEQEELVFWVVTTCAETPWQSMKSNPTTQGKRGWGTINMSSTKECNNTLVKSKRSWHFVTNQTHIRNALQPNLCPTLFSNNQHDRITCSVIWQGGIINAVKTFAIKNCVMCARDWTAILKHSRSNTQLLINSNNNENLQCMWTWTPFPQACKAEHPHHWCVNQWRKSRPNTQSCNKHKWVQHLPGWCPSRTEALWGSTKRGRLLFVF